MAGELYCSSEMLADRAAKSLVWVSGGAPSFFDSSFFAWVLTSIFVQSQHYTMALIDRVLDARRVIER